MSEVNQAFLRAYLKNRTAQASIEPSGTSQTETKPATPNGATARPSGNAPRNSAPAPAVRTATSVAALRIDPSHSQNRSQYNENRRIDSTQAIVSPADPNPTQPQAIPASVPVAPAATRQGVWSPLGVERGMKAMESTSVPAVVRNGVDPVSSQAAQFKSPMPKQHVPQQNRREELSNSNLAYDQVMYVDGLQGHTNSDRRPSTLPSEQTLAEITEPIAFGTGIAVPPSTPHSKSNLGHSKFDQPIAREERHNGKPTETRFDAPHSYQRSASPGSRTAIPSASVRPVEPVASKPAVQVPVPFAPSWEVDLFYWPEVVKQIEVSHADAFSQIGKHLALANRDGLKVMAITSGERGVGRSTVAMHMARCAAAAGLRVALVDGDTFCPSLVDQLRLDMEHGWQDCLFENVPLHEVAVHSIADSITLFPLTSIVSQHQMHANLLRVSKLIKRISTAFDMVFIDANRLNLEQRDMVGVSQETIVDAAIVVVDTELSIKEKIDSAVSILQAMGLSSIGLVENFQS